MSSDLSIESNYDSTNEFYLAPPLWGGHVLTWKQPSKVCGIQPANCFSSKVDIVGDFFKSTTKGGCSLLKKGAKKVVVQPVSLPVVTPIALVVKHLANQSSEGDGSSGLTTLLQRLTTLHSPVQSMHPLFSWKTNDLKNIPDLTILNLQAKVHEGGFKEFWEEHKKAIIITAVVVIAVGVVIFVVATQGQGSSVVVGGAGAIQALMEEYDSTEAPGKPITKAQSKTEIESKLEEGVENFGNSIGAETIKMDGPFRVIEVNSLEGDPNDILNNIVDKWDIYVAPAANTYGVDQKDPQPSLSLEPISVSIQTDDLLEFQPPSVSYPQNGVSSPAPSNPVSQPVPQNNLPWSNESSYLKWHEQQMQDKLLEYFLNKDRTSQEPAAQNVNSLSKTSSLTPPTNQNNEKQDRADLRPNQEFVKLIETKLAEAKDPNYLATTKTLDNPTTAQLARESMREYLEKAARTMLGPNHKELTDLSPLKSTNYVTEGARATTWRIGGINGMANSYEEMKQRRQYINQFVPGQSIDWVYNKSNSFVADLLEIFSINYPGFSPNTSNLLIENWTKFHDENLSNPNAKYLQFCHSQGAIHMNNALKNALPEIRNRVIVVAIAPGEIVPTQLCYQSFNYASKSDIVPFGQLFYAGLLDSEEVGVSNRVQVALEYRKELILLEPHLDAKGMDHDFLSPTFKDIIQDHVNDYMNHIGEYE